MSKKIYLTKSFLTTFFFRKQKTFSLKSSEIYAKKMHQNWSKKNGYRCMHASPTFKAVGTTSTDTSTVCNTRRLTVTHLLSTATGYNRLRINFYQICTYCCTNEAILFLDIKYNTKQKFTN